MEFIWNNIFTCPPAYVYIVLSIALAFFYIAINLYRGTFSTDNAAQNTIWLTTQCCAIIICCIFLTGLCVFSTTTAWIIVCCMILSALGSCTTLAATMYIPSTSSSTTEASSTAS